MLWTPEDMDGPEQQSSSVRGRGGVCGAADAVGVRAGPMLQCQEVQG